MVQLTQKEAAALALVDLIGIRAAANQLGMEQKELREIEGNAWGKLYAAVYEVSRG